MAEGPAKYRENKMISYLDLVEEYPREPVYTQFEKILMASKRAKAIHNEDKAPLVPELHKSSYLALAEIKAGFINLVYREDEPVAPKVISDDDDGDTDE